MLLLLKVRDSWVETGECLMILMFLFKLLRINTYLSFSVMVENQLSRQTESPASTDMVRQLYSWYQTLQLISNEVVVWHKFGADFALFLPGTNECEHWMWCWWRRRHCVTQHGHVSHLPLRVGSSHAAHLSLRMRGQSQVRAPVVLATVDKKLQHQVVWTVQGWFWDDC